ncbi:MAG: ABC transporter substrate-binding protein [Spirochaetaceae bacterium]|nr:ABC transporter substrate-binding protein [Spirochaetaceae bacterium]MCF7948201.1 ABC transporter substrate-binding protein [Spirochaetia bacterium]MCF7950817.1 ABC transporter substrate-binding protein [Spirochaetaceae bacterium]
MLLKKRVPKRVIQILLALALGGLLLFVSGCGQESETAEKQDQEKSGAAGSQLTDNPWTNGKDLSGTKVNIFGAFVEPGSKLFEESLVKFEDATGIDVRYEGSSDFESLITVRVEGGDPPDIAAFPQPGLLQDFVSRGKVQDISGWFEEGHLQEHYDQSWIDIATINNTMAGVWYRANVKSLVWYPKQEFEAAGYEIPETWDEMMALSRQMVEDGRTPWSIGIESSGATGWVATDWLEDIMLRTVTPEKYDAWVRGELPFNSEEVKRACNIMADIWFDKEIVLGGRNSILTVPFGDAVEPLFADPPRAMLHRQASFITDFFPEGTTVGEDVDFFYLPPIDEEEGRPVLGAGDIMGAFTDRPEVRAVMRFLSTGDSIKEWVQSGGVVAPHKDAKLEWYPTEANRKYAEILHNADTFRFDGSDMMPGQVGAGAFWKQMTNWVSGDELENALQSIDQAWPEEE